MAVKRVKEVVSRRGIEREIQKARKKLTAIEHRVQPRQSEAILRQRLQLDLCEVIVKDFHLFP